MSQHITTQFDWNSTSRTFTAEASELRTFSIDRLFDDAVDVGIEIASAVTKHTVVKCQLIDVEHNNDGDIDLWKFRNEPLNFDVVVFND